VCPSATRVSCDFYNIMWKIFYRLYFVAWLHPNGRISILQVCFFVITWWILWVIENQTSLSETIRKPPFVKAQTALKTKNMAKHDFRYGGCNSYTLQCGRWLWDDMPLNSPKRPLYRNSTSGCGFDHITAVDMSFCTSLLKFYPNQTNIGRKKWRHVDFQDGGCEVLLLDMLWA